MPAALHARRVDITSLAVDGIVNAAACELLGGGGVDGAIHSAAGPGLLEACRPLAPCATGDAVLTPGFALPARFVIHTVGPIWRGGDAGEDGALASCYRRALEIAQAAGLASLAFPAISTGVYGFPRPRAARIAVASVRAHLCAAPAVESVLLACFDEATLALYVRELGG